MEERERPIGVFDSGIGGLTVIRQLLARLPEEHLVYFGDTARVPYGTKSAETVTRFSHENTRFLVRRRIKHLVVACNTASAVALKDLTRSYDLSITGVIRPGAEAAVRATRNGRIGVIGTQATIRSGAYEEAVRALDSSMTVLGVPCPLFVPLAEEGWTEGPILEQVAHLYLDGLLRSGIDTLVLGCTHYPILKAALQSLIGGGVQIIDTAEETVRVIHDALADAGLLREPGGDPPRREYLVSDVPAQFREVGERFLGQPIENLVWVDQNDLPWYER